MKKIFKGAVCAGLCLTMLAAGCGNGSALDPETRALQLSINALDGNFNPFTYTALNDGEIASMTQIAMLTTDAKGNPVCGDDWPTVVQDYSVTMYDEAGNVTTAGSIDGTTEYKFLIKNGIKFSDGKDLTIKDVLFNLYAYLDPAYVGSSTIYSTAIKGLKKYRSQDPNMSDDSDSDADQRFVRAAQDRIRALVQWSADSTITATAQVNADYETVKTLFRTEAESDWTTVTATWQDNYKDDYRFTAAWQAYLFNEGVVRVQQVLNKDSGNYVDLYDDTNNNGKHDKGEKYYTTLDADADGVVGASSYINGVAAATTDDKVNAYISAHSGVTHDIAVEQLQKEYCVEMSVAANTDRTAVGNVVLYWGTATEALSVFTGDARSKYFDNLVNENEGKLLVESIEGITTEKATSFNGKTLGESYDVLKVVINGIDPKAIWNLGGFTVAPMHYYSGTYGGVNYVEEANKGNGFGVKTGDRGFFTNVIGTPEKNRHPVGAGAYKTDGDNFYSNKVVRFVRNEYFHTTGKNIENAKIKSIVYSEYNSDTDIMNALTTGAIDYATPNAKPENRSELLKYKDRIYTNSYPTGGYGYVGVNPKFVPELEIRQAIMKAMDTSLTITNYYDKELASQIFRTMSKTYTDYYPSGCKEYPDIALDTTDDFSEIKALVKKAGYVLEDGYYVKRSGVGQSLGSRLKFTFTIAGDSDDHPAYMMFTKARDNLNSLGFDISVVTDPQALKNMTSGSLAVWAAAWSSGVDPDMYQVYHKDSRATSVNNWNYPGILNDTAGIYTREYDIIVNELSPKIEEGRQYLTATERAPIYHECLDLIMSLAVELPTYQRDDMYAYNKNVLDASTLQQGTSYLGPIGKIWEVNYVK